jgi:ribonuclease HII
MKYPNLTLESQCWRAGQQRVVGVDEAGMGSLCGPVVAAAVLLPMDCEPIPGIRDSKTLSVRQRSHLYQAIHQQAQRVGVGAASVAEIDRLNILRAAHLAMQRALARIGSYDHALIDGRDLFKHDFGAYTAIVDGDASSYAIACASIIAKVRRDRFMHRLANRYPEYGWQKNVGYGTRHHLQALQECGITPWHRRSYRPIRQLLEQQTPEQQTPEQQTLDL